MEDSRENIEEEEEETFYRSESEPEADAGGHKSPLWMIIYTDMVTNLMIFFLLSYCLTWLSEKDRKIAAASFEETFGGKKTAVQQAVDKIDHDKNLQQSAFKNIENNVREKFSNVEISEEIIKITLPSPVLFDSGKAELKPETYKPLQEIADTIRNIPNTIVVEGHTDNKPISTKEFKSNWELSASRAFSVIRYFIDKEKIDPKRLSAFGYGEFRPKFSNDTEEHIQKNRRIEINITKLK